MWNWRDHATASEKFTQFTVEIQWLCLRSKCDKLTIVVVLIRVLSCSVVEPLTFISLSRLLRHLTGEIFSFLWCENFSPAICQFSSMKQGIRRAVKCWILSYHKSSLIERSLSSFLVDDIVDEKETKLNERYTDKNVKFSFYLLLFSRIYHHRSSSFFAKYFFFPFLSIDNLGDDEMSNKCVF